MHMLFREALDVQLLELVCEYGITTTCPCNKQIFIAIKRKISMKTMLIFFLFLHKTLIVNTCENHPAEAVLTSTNNLCIGSKIRKICDPGIPKFY